MTNPSTRSWLTSLTNLDRTLIAAAFALAVTGVLLVLGEKIQTGETGDGLGMDGAIYGGWAKDFHSSV